MGSWMFQVERLTILEPTIRNERLHEISNDTRVRLMNFAISRNLTARSTTTSRCNQYALVA